MKHAPTGSSNIYVYHQRYIFRDLQDSEGRDYIHSTRFDVSRIVQEQRQEYVGMIKETW